MEKSRVSVQTTSSANVAFGIVVLASYFATFSAVKDISLLDLILVVAFGIAYISIGIYGFTYVAKSDLLYARLVYMAVQIVLGGLIVSLGKGAGFSALLMLPLAGHAVVLLAETWAYVANLAIVGSYVVAVGAFSPDRMVVWSDLPIFLAGLIFIVVFTQVAVGEERSRREVERLNDELVHANVQLREYAMQVEDLAITQERNRLAREIHDGLGHYLTTIHMEIQAAHAVMDKDPQKAKEMLIKAQTLSKDALVDVRTSVAALRLSPEATQPLPKVVERLLRHCETLGIAQNLTVKGEFRELNPKTQLTLFRAAQESISNICKHSQAKNVDVTLDYDDPNWISLSIKDDGVGAGQVDGGFGLIGLSERVDHIQGQINTYSEPGQGFLVVVRVPG